MTPCEALASVLDAEHAAAFCEHRQRLRKPLTTFAAKLIAKKLAQVPDPNAGIEMAIERAWLGFEPSWYFDALAKLKTPTLQAKPTQTVLDLYGARTMSVSNTDELWRYLPDRPTGRRGTSSFTPEEVAAARARRAN